jgi:hypothetical protein
MYAKNKSKQKGVALIVAMLFVMVFSALSVAMFSMSSGNSLVASNLHKANAARSSAESGLEIIRYYLAQVEIDGDVSEDQWFPRATNKILGLSGVNFVEQNADLVTLGSDDSPITLNTDGSQSFYARVERDGNKRMRILVTGNASGITRKLQTGFLFDDYPIPASAFDFGVATKGPLELSGNILLDGVNLTVESDVYIESMNYNNALEIWGNSQIAGDVQIVNPDGYVTLQGGQAGIGTDENGDPVTGVEAIQNHVDVGVPETTFPIPDANHFEQYVAGGPIIDATTDLSTMTTLNNVTIAAGTNPTFTADTQINGVLFVEQPNVVNFGGNADITGVIVGNGDYTDNSGTNQIAFNGTVSSSPVTALPESFGSLREDTGTFMMAPGFAVSMGGNFGTLNGAIAANGVEFFGNAGGTIGGSVLNYSGEPMILGGNSDLSFNRTGDVGIPVGFISYVVIITYDPSDYEEII